MLMRCVVVLCVGLLAPCITQAQPPMSVPQYVDGVEGVWFRLDAARAVVAAFELEPQYQTKIRLLESQLVLRAQQVQLLQQSADASDAVVQNLSDSLDHANDARRKAEKALDAWYRSPYLWFSGGLVIGILAIVIPLLVI